MLAEMRASTVGELDEWRLASRCFDGDRYCTARANWLYVRLKELVPPVKIRLPPGSSGDPGTGQRELEPKRVELAVRARTSFEQEAGNLRVDKSAQDHRIEHGAEYMSILSAAVEDIAADVSEDDLVVLASERLEGLGEPFAAVLERETIDVLRAEDVAFGDELRDGCVDKADGELVPLRANVALARRQRTSDAGEGRRLDVAVMMKGAEYPREIDLPRTGRREYSRRSQTGEDVVPATRANNQNPLLHENTSYL